jgi:hypothetical protein
MIVWSSEDGLESVAIWANGDGDDDTHGCVRSSALISDIDVDTAVPRKQNIQPNPTPWVELLASYYLIAIPRTIARSHSNLGNSRIGD